MLNYPRNEDNMQAFIDGWDFTPDVGNGKSRGEIFTPRFIVDKMISMGIIPESIVYNNQYDKFAHGALDNDRFDHIVDEFIVHGVFDDISTKNSKYIQFREYSNNMFNMNTLHNEWEFIKNSKYAEIEDNVTAQLDKKKRDLKRDFNKKKKSLQSDINKSSDTYAVDELEKTLATLESDYNHEVETIEKDTQEKINKKKCNYDVSVKEKIDAAISSVKNEKDLDNALQKLIKDELIHPHDYEISNYKKFMENNNKVELIDYNKIISTTVQEPAVGTGNFSATIAWYKLNAAFLNSFEDGFMDEELAIENIIRAIQSIYYFDIDPGNVEVTTRRIFNYTDDEITSDNVKNYWVDKICDLLEQEKQLDTPDYNIDEDTERVDKIISYVENSLQEAYDKWNVFLEENDSILTQLYTKYFKIDPPEDLIDILIDINSANALVYNGISEFGDDVIPGTRMVFIQQYKDGEATDVVGLHNFATQKKMQEIFKDMLTLVENNSEYTGDDILQDTIESWDNKKNANSFNKLKKQYIELYNSLDIIDED